MAQEYKIAAVKQQYKEWESNYGPMRTYLCQFEGNGEPVQVNKKADSPVPQIGETVYGDIQETEYGQKFKSQKKPFKPEYQPRDDSHIRAQWAIGQALIFVTKYHEATMPLETVIEDYAKRLYAMVDRVKGSSESTDPKGLQPSLVGMRSPVSETTEATTTTTSGSSGYAQAKAKAEALRPKEDDSEFQSLLGTKIGAAVDNDEPINLDDIPF